MALELWSINEEKQQFNTDPDFKHDIEKELSIYTQLGGLFAAKMDCMSKLEEKKRAAVTFEQTFARATEGTDLLSKIQDKMRQDADAASPKHENKEQKDEIRAEDGRHESSNNLIKMNKAQP